VDESEIQMKTIDLMKPISSWFRKRQAIEKEEPETGWGLLINHSKKRLDLGSSESDELLSNINTFIVAFYKSGFDMDVVANAMQDGVKRIREMQSEEKRPNS
jgi:hypothetical protein